MGGTGSRRASPLVLVAVLLGWPLAASTRSSPASASEPAAGLGAARAGSGTALVTADRGRLLCRISDRRVSESSGLVATSNRLYTVNDGGDRLQVFVLDRDCQLRRVINNGLDPYDVEDLARTADGTLWLADIGDNAQARDTVAIELLTEAGHARLHRFRYPDGPHDAEAILVDPQGRPYLVTKEPFRSRVYTPTTMSSSSLSTRPTLLRLVATISLTPTGTPGGPVQTASQVLVTGGAVAPDGRAVVLRTYTDAYLWPVTGGDIVTALRRDRPQRIPLPPTRQGEAVTFTPDGTALLTSSEGVPAPVHLITLDPPGARADRPGAQPPSGGRSATPSPSTGARSGNTDAGSASSSGRRSLLGKIVVAAVVASVLVWIGGRVAARQRR